MQSHASTFSAAPTHVPSVESEWVADRLQELSDARSRGDAIDLQKFVSDHSGQDANTLIRLVYEDACLRRESGEPLESREILAGFPEFRSELAVLLEFDRLLKPESRPLKMPVEGDHLGGFHLLQELGRGASGRTFLAAEPGLADRLVVLKLQPLDQVEHLTLARLQNTHILPLFSERSFPDHGLRALCMPYLGGLSLDRILDELAEIPPQARCGLQLLDAIDRQQNPSSPPVSTESPCRTYLGHASWTQAICWMVACVADALQSAHERGLIHMDLKPSNVLLASDGLPILLDFHLARRALGPGPLTGGRLGGTPGWMSPEQEKAFDAARSGLPIPEHVDHRCDIYALGLLLINALDGPAPPDSPRPTPQTWVPRNSEISVGLADIIRRCIAFNPSERYVDAATLADDLRCHLGDLPLRGVANRSLGERWAKWRRRRPTSLVSGLACSFGLVVTVVIITLMSADYVRRVRGKDEALLAGRSLILDRRHAEAVAVLDRALKQVEGLIGQGRASDELRAEIQLARLGHRTNELHRLAETIRFHFGIDHVDAASADILGRVFPGLWTDRSLLIAFAANSNHPELREQIRTDLLELALERADALTGNATAGKDPNAYFGALRILEEASETCGPCPAILRRRRELASILGLAHSKEPAVSETASPWEHYDLGRSELRSGNLKEALDHFRRASASRPQDFWPHFYGGICAYRLEMFEDATWSFRVCAALSPSSPECAFNEALSLERLGRTDLAFEAYSRALALAPGLASAALNRGILAARRGDPDGAIADFRLALANTSDSAIRSQASHCLSITLNPHGKAANPDLQSRTAHYPAPSADATSLQGSDRWRPTGQRASQFVPK